MDLKRIFRSPWLWIGLGLLVATHRRTQLLGRQLVLRHPLPAVIRILAATRLHRILHIERTPLPISA